MATPAMVQAHDLNILKKSALSLIALMAIFFIYDNAVRYFNWSEPAYGYYWQFRLPLITHITDGVIALLAGIYQLWTGLNRTQMRTHPITGRIYAGGIVIGSAGAIMLSLTTGTYGLTFGLALFSLAVFWLLTTGLAIWFIRRKKVRLHQQWMTRSYILTFAFVTFRIITDYLPYGAWWGFSAEEISNATIWVVWVAPWIGYEVYLSTRQMKTATAS